MTDGDNGWGEFASTGKISDYLKYRKNLFAAKQEDADIKAAVAADVVRHELNVSADRGRTQEKERYE